MQGKKSNLLFVEMADRFGGSTLSLFHTLNNSRLTKEYNCHVAFYCDLPVINRFRGLAIKILMVKSRFAEAFIINLLLRMVYRIYPVLMAVIKIPCLKEVPKYILFISNLVLHTIPYSFSILKILKNHNISIIHLNDQISSNLEGILASALAGVPCICHLRSYTQINAVERYLANRFVSKFICISQAIKSSYVNRGIAPGKMEVIYNVRPIGKLNSIPERVKENYGINLGDFVVSFIGALIREKGAKFFILAGRTVIKKIDNVKFLIVGEGPELEVLKKLVGRLSMGEWVIFTGYQEETEKFYDISDIVVIPSIEPEGFACSVLESMARGKPVVGSNLGGIPEQIENNVTGFLVPAADELALAKKIETLLNKDTLRKRLGDSARKKVEEKFDISTHCQKIERIYRKILMTSRKRL